MATRTSFSGARTPSRNASTTAVSSSSTRYPATSIASSPASFPVLTT